jgi:excinuclease ABC subunit C
MSSGPRGIVARLPGVPGVYRFRDARGRVLYLGRAVNLRRRVGSYWGDLGDRRHLSRMIPRIARIEAVACDSEHEAAWLERNLLEHSLPPWNRTRGGQEVPVFVRLGRRLDVVHAAEQSSRQSSDQSSGRSAERSEERSAAGRQFGPYLGGARVRLAIGALHRVLPVAYASDRLTGTERDLARVRGVRPGDREALTGAVIAVLERDSVAVTSLREALTKRRDAAAAGLAFELAGRLQAEIEAVDWIAGEQKVTSAEPYDAEVHGWADGVLVQFGIRAGRLCTWRQRSCPADKASSALARTPAGWSHFARRSAELAARLAG